MILSQLAESLSTARDTAAACQRTLELIEAGLGLPASWIWLEDPSTGQFYSAAGLGLPPWLSEPLRMTGQPCWCIQAYQAGQLSPRVIECSRLRSASPDQTRGLRAHASIPLTFQGRRLGILNVAAVRALSADELELLSAIGYQLGLAIERSRLAEERERLARADERERLARELHDTLAQELTGAVLSVEGAARALDRPEVARARLEGALGQLRGSLDSVRGWMVGLRSPLEGEPLSSALPALARAFASRTGIRVQVEVEPGLTVRGEDELYRIAQEALANVEKHSGASEVQLSLSARALTVEDGGSGFDPRRAVRGHGLQGMRERARAIGARLVLRSGPGQGTRIAVRW